MLYELRIYECVPGKLPDLLKRFDTITLKLWEKHGIKQAGFWTTVIGESNQTLYYFVRESKAPETVGREAMDAGDPLLEAVCGARVGAQRAVANRSRSASVCCHVAGRRKAFGGVVGGCPSSLVCFPCARCGRGPG
jgi:hypothetical protein